MTSGPKEQLRFGLTSFGLVNCDYFFRNPADEYIALQDFVDQGNGDTISIPIETRLLLFNTNTYVQVAKSSVPLYHHSSSLIIFEYAKDRLGVLNLKRSSNPAKHVLNTIDISGMDANQIQKKILSFKDNE